MKAHMEKQIEHLRRRLAELEREMGVAVTGASGGTLWHQEMDQASSLGTITGRLRQDLREAEERLHQN